MLEKRIHFDFLAKITGLKVLRTFSYPEKTKTIKIIQWKKVNLHYNYHSQIIFQITMLIVQ